jgi:hypothetical protein
VSVDDAVMQASDCSSGSFRRHRYGRHQRFRSFIHHHGAGMKPHHQAARFIDAAAMAILIAHRDGHSPHQRRETGQSQPHSFLNPPPLRWNQTQIFAEDRDAHRTVSFPKRELGCRTARPIAQRCQQGFLRSRTRIGESNVWIRFIEKNKFQAEANSGRRMDVCDSGRNIKWTGLTITICCISGL